MFGCVLSATQKITAMPYLPAVPNFRLVINQNQKGVSYLAGYREGQGTGRGMLPHKRNDAIWCILTGLQLFSFF